MTSKPLIHHPLAQAGVLLLTYLCWLSLCRLVLLTLITYVLMSPGSHFEEMSQAFRSTSLGVAAIASITYLILLRRLYPSTYLSSPDILSAPRIEKRFFPGFVRGAALATAIVLSFLFSGAYVSLESPLQIQDALGAGSGILIRAAALIGMVFCEEFIFRKKLLDAFLKLASPSLSVGLVAVIYCAVKLLQFNLGGLQLLSLFLISLKLGHDTITSGDFARGAGFWSGILVVFYSLLGLPVLGLDPQGIFLSQEGALSRSLSPALSYFSGGTGGPLSGIFFQLILAVIILYSLRYSLRGYLPRKKYLLIRNIQ